MNGAVIQPYIQQTTTTITSFNVSCRTIELFNNASFTIDTMDANGNLIGRQVLTMDNENYLLWNNDDSFVITWAAQQLGFTLVIPEEPMLSGP